MNSEFKYGFPILFREPIWVSLNSDEESILFLKPLSYSTISSSHELQYINQKDDTFFKISTHREFIKSVIVGGKNIVGFDDLSKIADQLSNEDVFKIYSKIIQYSTVSREQLLNISDLLEIQFHPSFNNESWNCETCQAKGLDYSRGCGFLPEDKRDPAPMLPRIGSRRFDICPISTLDSYVLNQASMAHQFYSSGVLPETGSIGDQTEWFVKVALLYKRKISEAERDAVSNKKNKK